MQTKLNITNEEYIRIAARAFYFDAPEDFEDLDEAINEMRQTSTAMIQFTASPYVQVERDHVVLVESTGMVIQVAKDGAIKPRVGVTEQEFFGAMDKAIDFIEEDEIKDQQTAVKALVKSGWKVVEVLN